MKYTLTIFLLIVMVSASSAQFRDQAVAQENIASPGIGVEPAVKPFSLIDLSKVRWSHSYSVSFFSGGNSSGSAGLFNSTLFYDFSSKLSLAVNLSVAHSPSSLFGDAEANASFLPGFALDYHPSKNFQMSIQFQQVDGRFGRYSPASGYRSIYPY